MGDSSILFGQEHYPIPPKCCDAEVFTCTADHVGPCWHLLPCQSGEIAGSRARRLCHARAGRRPGVGIAGGSAQEREKQRRGGGTTPKERGAARCSFNGLGSWVPGRGLALAWEGAKANIQPLPIATRDKARLGRARKGWDSHNLRPIASRRAGCHNRV
jgi:hypothetical protein